MKWFRSRKQLQQTSAASPNEDTRSGSERLSDPDPFDPHPCQLCGGTTTQLVVHKECEGVALRFYRFGIDDLDNTYKVKGDQRVVRRLAPTCYLCGVAPTEHVEHVYPRARGGTDHWSNLGGACAACNMSKGGKVGITDEQQERLDIHQAALRAAANRITDDVLWQYLADAILELVELRADPDDWTWEEEEDIREELADYFQGWNPQPAKIIDQAVEGIMALPYNEA